MANPSDVVLYLKRTARLSVTLWTINVGPNGCNCMIRGWCCSCCCLSSTYRSYTLGGSYDLAKTLLPTINIAENTAQRPQESSHAIQLFATCSGAPPFISGKPPGLINFVGRWGGQPERGRLESCQAMDHAVGRKVT
jgi:hypothetical protein